MLFRSILFNEISCCDASRQVCVYANQCNILQRTNLICFKGYVIGKTVGVAVMLAGLLTKCSPVRTSKHRSMS